MRLKLFAILAAIPAIVHAAPPPPTPVEPVKETLHGVEVVDPYRWLEGSAGLAAPDKALDARVAAWTDAQNAYGRSVLDRLPGRKELETGLRDRERGGRGDVKRRGDRLFYQQIETGQQQPLLLVSKAGGAPRALLDPAAFDPSGLTTLAWYEPSPDGRRVACGLFRAGDENATLYLVETDSGTWLADEISNKVREVEWLPDGSAFLYNQLADLKNPSSRRIRFHRVGTHPRQDLTLMEQDKQGPGATTWGPFAHLSPDGHWAVAGHWMGSSANDLWVIDFREWLRTGKAARRPIVVGQQAQSGLPDVYLKGDPIRGDTLYMTTTLDAPNKRVVAVDLNDPTPGKWRELIPERKDAALQRLSLAGGLLAAEYLKSATTHIERFGLDGKSKGELPLPGLGSAGLFATSEGPEAFLTFASFNEPPTIYQVDVATGERRVWWRASVPFDPASVEVEQVGYPSKDGTRISMFLVHKKGLKRDGCNPTLLYGYGGFGISTTPDFDSGMLPWLEAGGLYALPNLRGGGEYGEDWHRAGMLEKKQNVFDDFIAAAEWLIAQGYTRPEKLAILGGSNGGLLIGAAVTQRPDLFAAGVAESPLLDMVRYQKFLRARNWIPEYGSSDDPKQLAWLLRYSPYHNVKSGVKYPALLITAGEQDERVHALHARKMTARLQAATASDPDAKPILLQVDRDSGHGMGKPADKQIASAVDEISFEMWQTGMGAACAARP
ncbi:MAG TPA: prolyl oligopeptidase family serine peptidase [Thermoanaerobaculia bacterium]|jgi:prolyl oligopeptidase|nr:prolyl oligopeptidase family serine peptidase [Thermoanaerobaculia bacterium]